MLTRALDPYQHTEVKAFDAGLLRRAIHHTTAALTREIGTHRSPNLPFSMALEQLDPDTSCGPFVEGLKKDYRDDNGEYHGKMLEHTKVVWDRAHRGELIENAYKLALKDELRPLDKCEEGKRRLLWGADVGVTTMCSAVFSGVAARLKSVAPLTPVCVGVNMDSHQVELMYQACQGRRVWCLDYSKWDSTMQPAIIASAVDILAGFCEPTPLTSSAARTLRSRAVGYVQDVKVETNTGLPSGMPFTSQVNSVCHMILFSMAVLKAYEKAGVPAPDNVFLTDVVFTYG